MITAMDHFTIVTDDLESTTAFYERLGLKVGPRPDFTVPGAWLYQDQKPVLHIVVVDSPPASRRGSIDHIAFSATGFRDVTGMLRQAGVSYHILRAPRPFSLWQLFMEDPNGIEVELDFVPEEEPPGDWKERAGRFS